MQFQNIAGMQPNQGLEYNSGLANIQSSTQLQSDQAQLQQLQQMQQLQQLQQLQQMQMIQQHQMSPSLPQTMTSQTDTMSTMSGLSMLSQQQSPSQIQPIQTIQQKQPISEQQKVDPSNPQLQQLQQIQQLQTMQDHLQQMPLIPESKQKGQPPRFQEVAPSHQKDITVKKSRFSKRYIIETILAFLIFIPSCLCFRPGFCCLCMLRDSPSPFVKILFVIGMVLLIADAIFLVCVSVVSFGILIAYLAGLGTTLGLIW